MPTAIFRRAGQVTLLLGLALPLLATSGCATRTRAESGAQRTPSLHNVAPRAGAADGPWRTLTFGLCEDYPEETRTLEQARRDLEIARSAGATVLRVAFGWDAMEPARGVYDWSFWDEFVTMAVEEIGLRLIPYVCYTPQWAARDDGPDFWRSPPRDPQDFARFMHAIVTRYRGAIDSWELWNEPDNRAYWLGTAEEFAELIRAGSRAVREADPGARVVLGGIATETEFIEELFARHGIAPAVDVVNIHSYFETWHPDPIETLPEFVGRVREIVREHGEDEPLWMAELGYSSVGARPVISEVNRARFHGEHSPEAQAGALVRLAALAMTQGILETFAWYRINDLEPAQEVIGDDNNRHLGIRTVGGAPKPAERAFGIWAEFVRQPFRSARVHLRPAPNSSSPVEVHAFEREDGTLLMAAWIPMLRSPEAGETIHVRDDPRLAGVSVSFPEFAQIELLDVHRFGTSNDMAVTAVRVAETANAVLTVAGRDVVVVRMRGFRK